MSAEKIYTIPINEAFDKGDGCPLCAVKKKVDADETERIIGAAMMEPDVRISTNAQGFCPGHLEKLMGAGSRLSLALTLKTHLEALQKSVYSKPALGGYDPKKQAAKLEKVCSSCYVCQRVNDFMKHTVDAFVYMWQYDSGFLKKAMAQPFYCLEHTKKLMSSAAAQLNKKDAQAFAKAFCEHNEQYLKTLIEDVDWFCKRFDYRYKDADAKNSKDSIERAAKFLNK